MEAKAIKWGVHEITLDAAAAYENPYTEVEVTAAFEGPAGTKIVKGFWDGGTTYRVRFAPTCEGTWRYTVSSKVRDAGLTRSGTIEVGPPSDGAHGYLRRAVDYPYSFVFDDGTRCFMWGTTYYAIVSNARASNRWRAAVENVKAYGINKIRMQVQSSFGDPSDRNPYPDSQPFEGSVEEPDHDRLNIPHWQVLDQVVQYVGDQRLLADLILFPCRVPYGTDDQSRHYVRYVLARYAAYPHVIWCLCNEWNYSPRDRAFWNEIGQWVRDEDPWIEEGASLRALSVHQQTRREFQFFDPEWPTHAIIQYGVRNGQSVTQDEWNDASYVQGSRIRHADVWGNHGIAFNLGHDIPVVNDEYGYMGEPEDKSEPDSPLFTRLKHRQVMWGIAAAGGYGSAGDKNMYADGRPYFSANWHDDPPEYRDIQHLVNFFTAKGIEYWKMSSQNGLIVEGTRVYALAEPGRQYVFYAAVGGRFVVHLSPGTYSARLYNPRVGEDISLGEVAGGGDVSFDTPDTADWVVYLHS